MTLSRDDTERLNRLRGLFLDEGSDGSSLADYWRDDADLEVYDAILAERIGWKWDAVLDECAARGLERSDDALVVDFGCGTGVASRRFVSRFGAREVVLHDRSPRAMQFAAQRLASTAPEVSVRTERAVHGVRPDVLLMSHVLGEIDVHTELALRDLIDRSAVVVIVEPGHRIIARRLSQLRDALRGKFRIIAPCTHHAACPALLKASDWCHFFAAPPPEVFTDGDWVRTARTLGIDLRALPYAFVAAVRDGSPHADEARARTLGRPTVDTRRARVHVCDRDGLRIATVEKRADPQTWRALKKHPESVRFL